MLLLADKSYAQHDYAYMCESGSGWSFGALINGTFHSKITKLKTTILSEPYFLGYTDHEKPLSELTKQLGGGAFIHYKIPNSKFGIENEITFSQAGGTYSFNNTDKDFNYDIAFRFQYVNFQSLVRYYPTIPINELGQRNGFFYVGLGPSFGVNVSQERIFYTSAGSGKLPEFGEDATTQQQLRNVLKGQNTFGLSAEVGFMIPSLRADISLRGHYSFTDAIETIDNPYNFIEAKNRLTYFQVSYKFTFSDN